MPDTTQSDEKPKQAPSSGTLGVLRVFGVPVRFHFTFVLLPIFLLFIGVGSSTGSSMVYPHPPLGTPRSADGPAHA